VTGSMLAELRKFTSVIKFTRYTNGVARGDGNNYSSLAKGDGKKSSIRNKETGKRSLARKSTIVPSSSHMLRMTGRQNSKTERITESWSSVRPKT
jgi:hypothetical protein